MSLCGLWMSHVHAVDPNNSLHGNKMTNDKKRFIEHRWLKKKVPYINVLLHGIHPHSNMESNEESLYGAGKGHKDEETMHSHDLSVNVSA